MCKSKADGGQRCYGHAAAAVASARGKYQTARAESETAREAAAQAPAGGKEAARAEKAVAVERAAYEKLIDRQVQLASTEQGEAQLQSQMREVKNPNNYKLMEGILRDGRTMRNRNYLVQHGLATREQADGMARADAASIADAHRNPPPKVNYDDPSSYERVNVTVAQLQPGDVLGGSGFTVTRRPYSQSTSRKGRLYVEGHYPNQPAYRHEWNRSTTMSVDRPAPPQKTKEGAGSVSQ